MRNLVIWFALLTGCVVSAQVFNPFHLFPVQGRSNLIASRQRPYLPLVLDSHVECIKALKGTQRQMTETNDIVQAVKDDLIREIIKLKKELNDIKQLSGAQSSSAAEVEDLKRQLDETKTTVEFLKSELVATQQQSDAYSDRFDDLTAKFEATNILIADLRTDLDGSRNRVSEVNGKVDLLAAELTESTRPSSIGKMPKSCADLQQIGHVKSGLYSVMGDNSVRNVYCDFTLVKNKNVEKFIGDADVKSFPTYFSVQRMNKWNTSNIAIPFDVSLVNIGQAMNLTSGVFTAPVAGVYTFAFHGLAEFQVTNSSIPFLAVGLVVNGQRIDVALTEESHTIMDNNGKGQRSPLSLMAVTELQKGDRVWMDMFSKSGVISLYDNGNKHTDFSGWLIRESISP